MDPLSISASVLALVTAAIKSGKALQRTVESFRSHDKRVRTLKDELLDLIKVLESLQGVLATENPILTPLKHPVSRCAQACREFEEIMVKCSERSGGERTSFRDWSTMKYYGGDITTFTDMLSSYKATITVALGCINMHYLKVTREVLDEYNETVLNAVSDIKTHLHSIDQKLASLASSGTENSVSSTNRQRIEEERETAEQCLQICEEAKSYIQALQDARLSPPTAGSQASAGAAVNPSSARAMTENAFNDFKKNMTRVISHVQTLVESDVSGQTPELEMQRLRLQQELDDAKGSLEVCDLASSQARVHILEDISSKDDSHQIVVSTLGDLLHGRRISSGDRATQWLGAMADASLQQLSRDHHNSKSQQPAKDKAPFIGKYGTGRTVAE